MVPIPDPTILDLSTTIELTRFKILVFEVGFNFFKVVTTSTLPASVSRRRPTISKVVIPLPNTKLLEFISSVIPSDAITAYLSSSKGKKV